MLNGLRSKIRDYATRVSSSRLPAAGRIIFSFVIDEHPKFAYEGYHLTRSILEHCTSDPADVHAHFTPEVGSQARNLFLDLGCSVHEIQRFGDGRYCNKIAQLANLHSYDFATVVLLDTDTIVTADLRPFLRPDALIATVVNLPNPPLSTLKEIGRAAGISKMPRAIPVDNGKGRTFLGNCNGGLYCIPKRWCQTVDQQWRQWASWLLADVGPLQRAGKEAHVDQVAMWLAIQIGRIPFVIAPSNINYHVHLPWKHRRLDREHKIAMIHYHDQCLNVVGLIEPKNHLDGIEQAAVAKANAQISRGFESQTFWNLRYSQFPERGSGIGSRGANLSYKRQLLLREGAEQANGVLDVGCGDVEVVKVLNLHGYLGVDLSQSALTIAHNARPDWRFELLNAGENGHLPSKELVLCFEVLIHQNTRASYDALVGFLAQHTEKTLIVSGYEHDYDARHSNSMLFYYEPLEVSLRRTGKFRTIRKIGEHSDVSIYRCDVTG